MQEADDVERYPLGAPIRPESEPESSDGEWVPIPDSPFLERNTVTGKWRNVRPTPAG